MDAFRICWHEPNGSLVSLMKGLEEVFFGEEEEAAIFLTNSCNRCNTHYQIELSAFGGQHAFVITRWIDLGSADTSTLPRWMIHTAREEHTWDLSPNDMQVNPRLAFEEASASYKSLDDLRSRNLAFLRGRKYRRVMKRTSMFSSVWSLRNRQSI